MGYRTVGWLACSFSWIYIGLLNRTRTRLICATDSAATQSESHLCMRKRRVPCPPPALPTCPPAWSRGCSTGERHALHARFMFANLCDTAAAGDTGQSNAKVRQTDMAKEMVARCRSTPPSAPLTPFPIS